MIRAYRNEDLETLLDVWYRASRAAHPFLDEAFLERERRTIATVFLPKARTWVYLQGADLVGFVSLLGHEIGGLFVDPTAQRQGIGRALLGHIRSLHQQLEVDVFKANDRGCRFYKAMGFVPAGERLDEKTGQLVLRMRLVASVTNRKRLRSVCHSIAHHAVSGLSYVHPHVLMECRSAGVDRMTARLLDPEPCPEQFRENEPLRLSLRALRTRFLGILASEDLSARDLTVADITFRPHPAINDYYSSICRVELVPRSGKPVECTVDHLGRKLPLARDFRIDDLDE